MNLPCFANWYNANSDICDEYGRQLLIAAEHFHRCQGGPELSDITAEHLNSHLKVMRRADHSDTYIKQRRTNLLILMRAARRRRLNKEFRPGMVMRVRVSDRVTKGWTIEEVRRLIGACDGLKGKHPGTGVARRLWWRSYLMARWDTGLDDPTLRSIERDWIPPHRAMTVIRGKTGKRVRIAFHEATMEAIDASFPPDRALCWPLWGTKESMRKEARKLISWAGIKGSLKFLRSGSGSNFEMLHPGRGHQHLGNTRAVFEKHYEIADIVQQEKLLPEPLVG